MRDFASRHIGVSKSELGEMLRAVGVDSLDALIDETIPASIRLEKPLTLPEAVSESRFLEEMRQKAGKNKTHKSYIGLGYYDCFTPGVIQRNIFENPGWYTQYTPYQAEISQGRLEALLNFQTMVMDLTGMEVANASLLDEGTAAAEAMTMLARLRDKKSEGRNAFFVSDGCFPQTIDVLKSRAAPLDIEIIVGGAEEFEFGDKIFGALVQYPDADGEARDYSQFAAKAKQAGAFLAVAADILSLTLLKPPGEWGADVVVGSAQRLGVPMGYGGPHAAYFATRDEFKRQIPGRIIGVSIDAHERLAYRMAIQTREQHIRREKATSNICTAQALLAIMAGMYAVYHGGDGLIAIARKIRNLAKTLEVGLSQIGFRQLNRDYFDTLKIEVGSAESLKSLAEGAGMNFRYIDSRHVGISLDETTEIEDAGKILGVFAKSLGKKAEPRAEAQEAGKFPESLARKSGFLSHPVFSRHQSETKMLRYIKRLEARDLSLCASMIPLGSCTMKLNATSEMTPLGWREFSKIHPFAPLDQALGYAEIFTELEGYLSQITGFDACSLQPNSGAQGEYAGLMVMRAYHGERPGASRNVVLIPSSAHGTNPASASMAGMRVVVVECDEGGNIDLGDLSKKAAANRDALAGLMITYPSTHGVFEENIRLICSVIHEHGGLVYMDGANMNAQAGITNPAAIGADLCHLNLHKTFSIPHGGGGPGMGPICVKRELAPYLPGHKLIPVGGERAIAAVSSAPWGSGSILLISYGYIRMLGARGVADATKYAILNANYLKSRLEGYYPVLYTGSRGRVAHEMILDLRQMKSQAKIEVEDVAKRLMDFGFHAPTVSWPVPGTIMIEPTESESKDELDRFADALIAICEEAREIAEGRMDAADNPLKRAPHTAAEATSDDWKHPYSRAKAAYPLPYLMEGKFWPPVGRINNAWGDKNLVCSCPPLDDYRDS
ncbi:MAG: aminomethyl-transferring glycine dehydrogenase [Deltaproteobacteria bacterium]